MINVINMNYLKYDKYFNLILIRYFYMYEKVWNKWFLKIYVINIINIIILISI